jgi:hypothetical protein
MNNIYLVPSFYAHILNGIFLMVAVIILYTNYSSVAKLEPYKMIMLVLLFSIGFGIHSLSHLGLEKVYNFNPLETIYS